MPFTLTIDKTGDAYFEDHPWPIAALLTRTANELREYEDGGGLTEAAGAILSPDGNTVGRWRYDKDQDEPPSEPPEDRSSHDRPGRHIEED